MTQRKIKIRRFKSSDAELCFKIRIQAFIKKFYGELSPEEVAAGINAYLPEDYIRMAKNSEFFMVENKYQAIGFFTLKKLSISKAEIPLIYIDLNHLHQGIGTSCIHYIEEWIRNNWKKVRTLIVETIIPRYNGGFYQKIGFTPVNDTVCYLEEMSVKALRLKKSLN